MPDSPATSSAETPDTSFVPTPASHPLLAWLVPLVPITLSVIVALAVAKYHPVQTAPVDPPPAAATRPAIDVGSTAPDFTLRDAKDDGSGTDAAITLSQALDKHPVLLVYYLGYSCPRCVEHLRELADQKAEFDKLGIQIIAVSPNTVAETRDSVETWGGFPFPLLSDADLKVAKAYGLFFGDETFLHGLFLIDTHRKVQFAMKSSHPYDNVENLLATIRGMQAEK